MSGKVKDLTGLTFGKLTVIRLHEIKNHFSIWECHCDCGKTKNVLGTSLNRGNSKSCGCGIVEATKTRIKHGAVVDGKKTPEYTCWQSMKDRCLNPNCKAYKNYGAKGITICERWQNSFENFLSDMGKRPSIRYSLERINGRKNYSPNNCKWATRIEQNGNTNRNVVLTYKSQKMILSKWADYLKVKYPSITRRFKKQSFAEIVEYFKSKNNIAD